MRYRIFATEKVVPEQLTIIFMDIAMIAPHEPTFLRTIEGKQSVPSDLRMYVVHSMKIIVQKQKGQQSIVFNNSGARAHILMGTVFGIGTNFQKAQPAIGRDEIGPNRKFSLG